MEAAYNEGKHKNKTPYIALILLLAILGIVIFALYKSDVTGTYKEPIRNFAIGCANHDIEKLAATSPSVYLKAMEQKEFTDSFTANRIIVYMLGNESMVTKLKYTIHSADVCSADEIASIEKSYADAGAEISVTDARKLDITWKFYEEYHRGRRERRKEYIVFQSDGKWYLDSLYGVETQDQTAY